ncbi:MAG TPA: PQQ-binding-like beta-propeller repeat protein [Abditibacteriaceae bacterium]|jgi:outer membrane protein assembly factor BamB|nr:PQQ-binding-like beta-propeller repeat protein [Abditibacteriaceae bacterium]
MNRLVFSAAIAALSLAPRAHCAPSSAAAASSATATAPVNCLTFHYDNARLGWNPRETQLTPTTVRPDNFGMSWKRALDGPVPGSPLVAGSVRIGGKTRAVVYAATEHNSVFALDAQTGRVLWSSRRLVAPVSEAEFSGSWNNRFRGILSTPVIDLKTQTIYTCGVTRRGLRQQFIVWALDIRNGKLRPGWPQTVRGQYAGKPFIAGEVMQRGALSLVNGRLYIPFGGRGDIPPWRGWLIAFNTRRPSAPPFAFCPSPRTDGAGIWSAAGVTATNQGDVFGVTGNGEVDVHKGGHHLGQTVFRLRATTSGPSFKKRATDYFTPTNFQHLNDQDEDLGGASAVIIPDLPQSSTRRLLFVGGKDGMGYLLNRDNLGGIGGALQQVRLFGKPKSIYHEGIRATAAYFDAGAKGRFLMVAGDEEGAQNKSLVALRITASGPRGAARVQPVWTLKATIERPSTPIVTSNGARNGVVWLVETRDNPGGVLRAYDALTGRELFNSDQGEKANRLPQASRFVSPTVANGRVFLSTSEGIFCFAAGPQPAATTAIANTAAPRN